MLTVLAWYWKQPGGRVEYLPLHVNIWADMVRANLSMPHRICCVTDHPGDRSASVGWRCSHRTQPELLASALCAWTSTAW
jgi:hypothetical protein